jgi:hypothetical protein
MPTKKIKKYRRILKKVLRNSVQGPGTVRLPSIQADDFQKFLKLDYNDSPYKFVFEVINDEHLQDSLFSGIIRSILGFFDRSSVEVSISLENTFSPHNHHTEQMEIEDFLSYKGELKLYIAQIPLVKKMRSSDYYNIPKYIDLDAQLGKKFSVLKQKISRIFSLPNIIQMKMTHLEYCNIWINRTEVISDWHYDFYENYLVVLKGRKRVQLLNYNLLASYENSMPTEREKGVKIKEEIYKNEIIECELKQNEFLRIPEGWYHKVTSDPETIGLNFWFQSSFEKRRRLFPIFMNNYVSEILFDKQKKAFEINNDDFISSHNIREAFIEQFKVGKEHQNSEEYQKDRFLVDLVDNKIDFSQKERHLHFCDIGKKQFYSHLDEEDIRNSISRLEDRLNKDKIEEKMAILRNLIQ